MCSLCLRGDVPQIRLLMDTHGLSLEQAIAEARWLIRVRIQALLREIDARYEKETPLATHTT